MSECPEELFPLIFDSVNEGVFTVDEDFRITSFNEAAERIIGISREEAVGRPCHEVLRANRFSGDGLQREPVELKRNVGVQGENSRSGSPLCSAGLLALESRKRRFSPSCYRDPTTCSVGQPSDTARWRRSYCSHLRVH